MKIKMKIKNENKKYEKGKMYMSLIRISSLEISCI